MSLLHDCLELVENSNELLEDECEGKECALILSGWTNLYSDAGDSLSESGSPCNRSGGAPKTYPSTTDEPKLLASLDDSPRLSAGYLLPVTRLGRLPLGIFSPFYLST
jgi:hypothetical protein